jgi:3',5'-cyclic-AMP phosphodiesterase
VADDAVVIAQMSDTHIGEPGYRCAGIVDTARLFEQAVEHVNRLDPDLVLVTGDLVDGGGVGQYAHFGALLAPLRAPVHLLPGNHDDREALWAAFPKLSTGPSLEQVFDAGPVRLILLDDVIPDSPCGRIGEVQLGWLDLTLAADPRRPTVIALHHPPFVTGIAHMDTMGLEDAAAFGEVIERHPHVERIVCGHLHRPIVTRWCGTVVVTAPSVAHQIALDLGPEGPARFIFEPPAVLVHRWSDGELVTHVSYVGSYEGPYTFDGKLDPRS